MATAPSEPLPQRLAAIRGQLKLLCGLSLTPLS